MVIQPNSGVTYTGLWSQDHKYPASQRNFKVSSREGADSNEVIQVSTADGVKVGVDGTFYFNLNTDPKVLKEFDDKFGTRTFPVGDTAYHAWDGDEGQRAMLDFTLSNLMQTIFREEVGKVKCQDLYPGCSLAINPNAAPGETDKNVQADFVNRVNRRFSHEVKSVLGGDFFVNPTFALGGARPSDKVVESIDNVMPRELSHRLARLSFRRL